MGVEATLYSRMTTHTGLSALISTRAYPRIAPQGVTKPYIVFSRVTAERFSAMGGDTGDVRSRFQFDIYGSTYTEAKNVADQLRLALKRWSGSDVQDIYLEMEMDDFEEDPHLVRLIQQYTVFYTE